MSEMVERATRAASAEMQRQLDATETGRQWSVDIGLVVRATIAAMREPTEAMDDAPYRAELDIRWGYFSDGRPWEPKDVWRVMIDEALKP